MTNNILLWISQMFYKLLIPIVTGIILYAVIIRICSRYSNSTKIVKLNRINTSKTRPIFVFMFILMASFLCWVIPYGLGFIFIIFSIIAGFAIWIIKFIILTLLTPSDKKEK